MICFYTVSEVSLVWKLLWKFASFKGQRQWKNPCEGHSPWVLDQVDAEAVTRLTQLCTVTQVPFLWQRHKLELLYSICSQAHFGFTPNPKLAWDPLCSSRESKFLLSRAIKWDARNKYILKNKINPLQCCHLSYHVDLLAWDKYQKISNRKIILKLFSLSISLENLYSEFLIEVRFGLTGCGCQSIKAATQNSSNNYHDAHCNVRLLMLFAQQFHNI